MLCNSCMNLYLLNHKRLWTSNLVFYLLSPLLCKDVMTAKEVCITASTTLQPAQVSVYCRWLQEEWCRAWLALLQGRQSSSRFKSISCYSSSFLLNSHFCTFRFIYFICCWRISNSNLQIQDNLDKNFCKASWGTWCCSPAWWRCTCSTCSGSSTTSTPGRNFKLNKVNAISIHFKYLVRLKYRPPDWPHFYFIQYLSPEI